MKPNFVNMSKTLGRIEEIERRGRSLAGLDSEAKKLPRFVDVLEETQKEAKIPGKGKPDAKKPSRGRGLRNPGSGNSIDKSEFDKHITKYCKEYGIDEKLVRAVIRAESGFNPNVQSPKGAMGLMQLMPGTAKMLGVDDPWDPEQNIEGGIKYLSQLSDKFGGDVERMLAGYNAGPHRVDQYGGIPPYKETQNYVKKITEWLND